MMITSFTQSILGTAHLPMKTLTRLTLLCITLGAGSLLGCKGDIGDECIADAQCQAGQVCDTISEGGYCTLADCRDDECPQGSICVTFENDDRYCMATCSSSGDCREEYYCEAELGPESFCRQSAD